MLAATLHVPDVNVTNAVATAPATSSAEARVDPPALGDRAESLKTLRGLEYIIGKWSRACLWIWLACAQLHKNLHKSWAWSLRPNGFFVPLFRAGRYLEPPHLEDTLSSIESWRSPFKFTRATQAQLTTPSMELWSRLNWGGLVGPHASSAQLKNQLQRFSNDPRKAANGSLEAFEAHDTPW